MLSSSAVRRPDPVPLVIIAGALGLGGAEQQLFYFLQSVPRDRWRPSVAVIGGDARGAWTEPIRDLGVPVHFVSPARSRRDRIGRLAGLLKETRPQIVHSWLLYFNPHAYLAGKWAGVPVRLGSFREDAGAFPGERVFRWISHATLHAVVANSRTTAANVPRFAIQRAAVRVVPNGVSLNDDASPEEARSFRSRLGVSEDAPLVGAVGRLDDNKNFASAIRAFAAVSRKHPAARLVIVGDGPEREALPRLADELGVGDRVVFAGAVPGAARYFGAFRILCLTSQREGMPNVLLEAALRGIPAVATRAGAAAEIVDHGVTGYLAAPGDSHAIGAYIDRLLSDDALATRMGAAGRRKIAAGHRIDAMVSGITGMYDEALAAIGRSLT